MGRTCGCGPGRSRAAAPALTSPRPTGLGLLRGPARAGRGAVVALLLVGLSAVGHANAGGHGDARIILALAAAGFGVCWLLSAREWTVGRLLVVLTAGQVVVHYALEAGMAASTAVPTGAGAVPMPGMPAMTGPGSQPPPALPPAPLDALGAPSPTQAAGLWMLWAHVVAVVVATLAVRYSDALALRVVDLLTRPLRAALPPQPVSPPDVAPWQPHPRVPAARRVLQLATSVVRRGPPLAACG